MEGRHPSHRLRGADEGADDVRGHDPLQALGVHLVDAALLVQDPDVVDKTGQRAEFGVHGQEQPLRVVGPGHVGLNRDRVAAARDHVGDDRPGGLGVHPVADADPAPEPPEAAGDRRADSPASSGDGDRSRIHQMSSPDTLRNCEDHLRLDRRLHVFHDARSRLWVESNGSTPASGLQPRL